MGEEQEKKVLPILYSNLTQTNAVYQDNRENQGSVEDALMLNANRGGRMWFENIERNTKTLNAEDKGTSRYY